MTPHIPPTRRDFIAASVGLFAGGLLPWQVALGRGVSDRAPRPRAQAQYGLVMLGDLHYDQWRHHDIDWVNANRPPSMHRQIQGYVDSTDNHLPQLLQRIREQIKHAPAPIASVVHIGDFVQGLCGSYELQAMQSREAIAAVDAGKLGAPFIMAKGNHDVTGPGSEQAFDDVLLPWMSTNVGEALESANFTWRRGNDLFVFFDAYQPDIRWLESLSREAELARHVFFVIHPPVVPYNARADWHIFSQPDQAEDRSALLAWLGRHRAIVLCGHLHRYGLLTRQDHHGTFTQFAINSVVRNDRESPGITRSGLDEFGPDLVALEPDFSPETLAQRKAWLEAEKPFILDFDYARVPGYALLWVYDDRVEADVYLGHADTPWKQPAFGGRPHERTPAP